MVKTLGVLVQGTGPQVFPTGPSDLFLHVPEEGDHVALKESTEGSVEISAPTNGELLPEHKHPTVHLNFDPTERSFTHHKTYICQSRQKLDKLTKTVQVLLRSSLLWSKEILSSQRMMGKNFSCLAVLLLSCQS